ncbi:hypothetical protein H0H92_001032 [Tricholoma furcatifolium]|nr:hypothetical protein H0H92_001032 [Tricholoma furcatifolium]
MPSKDNIPSGDTTNIYARCYPALAPVIARSRRHQPPSTRRSDDVEWLVWNIVNLGNRKLGRGDCILLADIAGPPPSYNSQGTPQYPELRLLIPQPYEEGHPRKSNWKAYVAEDTSTREISIIHFPKRYITSVDTPHNDIHSPMEYKLTERDIETVAEEITRRRTCAHTMMEIRYQIGSETVRNGGKHHTNYPQPGHLSSGMSRPYPNRRPDSKTPKESEPLDPTYATIAAAYANQPKASVFPEQAPPYTAKPSESLEEHLSRPSKRLSEASPEKPKNRTNAKKRAIPKSPGTEHTPLPELDTTLTSSPELNYSDLMDDTPPSPTPAARDRPPHLPTIPPLILDNTNLAQSTQPAQIAVTTGEDVEMAQNRPNTNTVAQTQPHARNAPQPAAAAQEERAPVAPLNLPPNVTLPDYTPAPPMGFPVIHLGTLPSYWMDEEVMKDFNSRPEPKFWARLWLGVHDEKKYVDDINTIRRHIYFKTAEKALIIPPTAKEEPLKVPGKMQRFHPPYHYLVTGLSPDAAKKCLDAGALSCRDTQIFFLSYDAGPSLYIATIAGFTFSLDDLFPDEFEDADSTVTKTIRATITSDTALGNIIASRSTIPISAENFARNVYAVSHTEEIPKGRGESRSAPPRRATHWNLYFRNPPSLQSDGFFLFAKQFRRTLFRTPDRGRGRALEGPMRYHCVLCKGADHNPPRCPYLSIPGWYGTATQFQRADGSLEWVTGEDRDDDEDRASNSRNNYGNNNNRGRRGGRR